MKKNISVNKKRVLLADAGFSSIPLLNALKECGFIVGVCGLKKDDPCHKLADESHIIDYSDTNALEKLYSNNKYDFLVAGCTDISYLSCAVVAEKLNIAGFDSPSTNRKIFNKNEFRSLCQSLDISSPKFFLDSKLASTLRFPILKKPIDSFSGKGIEKFHQKKDLAKHNQLNQMNNEFSGFVYEEFVEGQLYSHSAFIKNGQITNDFFVLEYSTIHPYQVNSSHLDKSLKSSIKNRIRRSIVKIAKSCDLTDGLIHTQFISDNSEFWMIEMTRRCPGDLYSLLIQLSTGINYPELYINSYLNMGMKLKLASRDRFFSRHTLSTIAEEIFTGIHCDVNCMNTITYNLKKLGEKVNEAPFDRAAVIFLEHKTSKEMKLQTPNLYKKIFIER
jgi:biotin carboxylase